MGERKSMPAAVSLSVSFAKNYLITSGTRYEHRLGREQRLNIDRCDSPILGQLLQVCWSVKRLQIKSVDDLSQ